MKPPRVFVVSDTHLGHRLMATVRPWPTIEEHDAEIIARWNDTVRPQDIVWHLGDAVMNRRSLPLVAQLNGHKRLVMGNHDTMPAAAYLDAGFEQIHGAKVVRGDVLLTHVPVHPNQLRRFRMNVHGHMHAHAVRAQCRDAVSGAVVSEWDDVRYRCVSLERTDYRPMLLSDVAARSTTRSTT